MAGSGGGELRAPIFTGENYEFWSIKMKTIFKSHGLWEFVEKGIEYSNSKGAEEVSDAKKKENEGSSAWTDSGSSSNEIFPRISHEETSKGAWDILMQEFHGDKHVRSVKLQGLRREFEDIDVIEVQEVVASLKSFAQRLERHSENKTERAFASLSVNPKPVNASGNRYQKNWKPKFKKWDQKPAYQSGKQIVAAEGGRNPCKHCDKYYYGECFLKGKPKSNCSKCHFCGKLGHIARDCNNKKNVQQLNYATQVPTMFYVNNAVDKKSMEDVWYVDSGCSNHMTGREDVLVDVDRSITAKVEMGAGQLVDVVGKYSLVVDTKMGRRYIKEVMLVSGLKENLLNV
ncbi:unnamed protein product [Malus baccata var. baccata]